MLRFWIWGFWIVGLLDFWIFEISKSFSILWTLRFWIWGFGIWGLWVFGIWDNNNVRWSQVSSAAMLRPSTRRRCGADSATSSSNGTTALLAALRFAPASEPKPHTPPTTKGGICAFFFARRRARSSERRFLCHRRPFDPPYTVWAPHRASNTGTSMCGYCTVYKM